MVLDERGRVGTHMSPAIDKLGKTIFPRDVRDRFAQAVRDSISGANHKAAEQRYDNFRPASDDEPARGSAACPSDSPRPLLRRSSIKRPNIRRRASSAREESHLAKRRKASSRDTAIVEPIELSDSDSMEDSESNSKFNEGCHDALEIGDEKALQEFFDTRFKQFQQLNCKAVAKQWIKVVEPKKQTNFPYKAAEDDGPPWWPKGVRHREPDHLLKPERLALLMTLLRLWKKEQYKHVTVSSLEASTKELKFDQGKGKDKRHILDEIYRVAKMEEELFSGAIDSDTIVYVASSAKIPRHHERFPSAESNAESCNTAIPSSHSFDSSERIPMEQHHSPDLVVPVNHLDFQGARAEQISFPDRSPTSQRSEEEFYSNMGRPPPNQHLPPPINHADYQSQYVQQLPMEETSPYAQHPNQMAQNANFLPRGTPFMPPNSGPGFRERGYNMSPHATQYQSWPSPAMSNNFGPQMHYPYLPTSAAPPNQPISQHQYQLPPVPHNTGGLPSMMPHQVSQPLPDLPGARVQPQFDGHMPGAPFRTGSLSHPHGIPHQPYEFLHDDAAREYMHLSGQVPGLKSDPMTGS
ncbi:MAG: hypothetical protein M1819_007194 [Sarea resinae]|nr:MAG: hypothetical protein M1819_007194 [Sarea resinae]